MSLSTDSNELTDQQRLFVEQYVVDFNGTQAAIRAGYSPNAATEQASRLLTYAKVQKAVEEAKKAMFDRIGLSQERVLREYARIGFFDIRKLYDQNSRLKSIGDLDDDEAAALAGVEVDEIWANTMDGKEQIGDTKKVRLWDKMKALDALGKYIGAPPSKVELTGKDGGTLQMSSTVLILPSNGTELEKSNTVDE